MPGMHKLTARSVTGAMKPGLYADGGGLYLQVTIGKDGAPRRSWVLRFTAPNGRRREMGLGSVLLVDLAAARELALSARKQAVDGEDPIVARDAAKNARIVERPQAMTFRRCAEAYIAAHEQDWKNAKHRWQWRSTLEKHIYPVFGDLDVAAVDDALVMRALDPIWQTKNETASRLRGRIEAILDWAKVRGLRTGENPARWRGHLQKALPAPRKAQRIQHHPALAYAEIPAFMAKLRAKDGVSARALEFTILTAARTGETIGAVWDEIDLDAGIWTIPAARMKAGKEHRVPLSDRAVEILRERSASGATGPVFTNAQRRSPLSNMAQLMLLRRLTRAGLTVHGFRSTFRDWAAEQTDVPREVAEAALAHALEDKVEAAYRRSDLFEKRRALMAAWGQCCAAQSQPGDLASIKTTG